MNDLSKMIGKIATNIELSVNQIDQDRMLFTFSDGETCELWHPQDCCEDVFIEDICGDITDLIGSPILVAEERVSHNEPEPSDKFGSEGSHTWTFYTFRTIEGSVDVRWYGTSNGYYSEEVLISWNEQ